MSGPGQRGASFMLDGLTDKAIAKKNGARSEKRIVLSNEYSAEDVAAVIHDNAASKAAKGLKSIVAGLGAIADSGLTPEAIVLLTAGKTGADKNRNPTSPETVRRVLEGFFRLGEYLR